MGVHIALLRAVNLGQHGKVSMAALTGMAKTMGLDDPHTVLQTGNLVFRSDDQPQVLEARLEDEARRTLGLDTPFILRTAEQWRRLVAANPFPQAAIEDPSHMVVMPMKAAPSAEWLALLRGQIKGPEQVEAIGRDLYLTYPDGIGRSKLNGAPAWRRLETVGTARNWNTVLKLQALAGSVQG